ncbi:MAG: response regulator [Bacteroidetes bacterium]|nr:response regulator [Bacteroidota bacterium]
MGKSNQRHSVWILDDDKSILSALEFMLNNDFEELRTFSDPEKLQSSMSRQNPDVLLMDMNYTEGRFDGSEGMQLIDELMKQNPHLPVVAMTAYGDVEIAVNSMKRGAVDFISKPWKRERLITTLHNAIRLRNSEKQLHRIHASGSNDMPEDLGMIGNSAELKEIRDRIRKVADTDASVLILGENGTGKELVARAIHQLSGRNLKPFVKIDLGAIHGNLFESELFGALKGSYSGIQKDKPGKILLADRGTLFLDEIGNLPLPLQSKMLSVLQNCEVTPVGGIKAEKLDTRLICATNLSEDQLFDPEHFRQDLLYRINTVEIHLPPLRNRKKDIPLLMEYFIEKFATKYGKGNIRISQEARKSAEEYAWPGNIRELEHAMERAVVLNDGRSVSAADLIPVKNRPGAKDNRDLNLSRTEEDLIREAISKNGGSITKAARDLGLTRASLYRRLEKYGL